MAIDVNIWITSFCRQFISNTFVVSFVRSLNNKIGSTCCTGVCVARQRDGNNEKETTFSSAVLVSPDHFCTPRHVSAIFRGWNRHTTTTSSITDSVLFSEIFGIRQFSGESSNIWSMIRRMQIHARISSHLSWKLLSIGRGNFFPNFSRYPQFFRCEFPELIWQAHGQTIAVTSIAWLNTVNELSFTEMRSQIYLMRFGFWSHQFHFHHN